MLQSRPARGVDDRRADAEAAARTALQNHAPRMVFISQMAA